jgi:ATP-binding cassette subfamily B (MDR/TAP) protein 1
MLTGEALTARLRRMTFDAMLSQEQGWYDDPSNNVGALCSRLSGDCAHVQGATGSRIGSVVQALSTIFLGIGLSMYYNAKLGAVAIVFTPFVVLATYFQMKLMTGQNLEEKKAVDEASKVAVQAVGNIRTVAALGKERAFVNMYQGHLTESHERILKMAHLRGFIFGFAQSVPYFAYATVMYYGGWLVQNEGLQFDRVFK